MNSTWIKRNRRQHGMALVMVVLMLALMLVLMLAVYSLSDAELKGASKYASSQQGSQFGDLAIDIAISQVRRGSTPDATKEGREIWISQPGMIRQYLASGDLLAGYKLYSSSEMIVAGGVNAEKKLLSDAPPTNWQELKARYVDLNRPAHRVENNARVLRFPIIDPRAMTAGADTVAGFSYSDKLANGRTISGVRTTGADSQRLPMPVEWLYVLSDGTLGTLDADNRFVGASVPTAENPITGRIAFWADDESSKVNINTASEPTPWAVPTFFHEEDANYARYQPVSGEFQRYPGHPATTALSPILFPGKTLTVAEKDLIYGLAPKIGPGGSNAGTMAYNDKSIAQIKLSQHRTERLYASLDEFLLREDRTENNFGLDVQPREVLRRKGFFLTAHSRAPELNLHGLPKIALWPVSYRGADYSTTFDQLIAFCGTLRQKGSGGTRKYIFQRGYADSTTQDIQRAENQALLTYLYSLLEKPIPGFAASSAQNYLNKYGDDLRQILVEVFDYVRSTNLYDGNIVQDTVELKQGNKTQNHLLGYSAGSSRKFNFKTFTDFRQFDTVPEDEDTDASSGLVEMLGNPGHGQVTPSKWTVSGKTYQGIGRFPTVTEVGLHFICAADNTDDPDNPYQEQYATMGKPGGRSAPTLTGVSLEDGSAKPRWYSNFPPLPKPNPKRNEKANLTLWPKTGGYPYGPDAKHPGYYSENWNHQLAQNTPLAPGVRRVQARLLLEYFIPAAGYTLIEPEFTVVVSGLSRLRLNNKPLFPRDSEVFYTGRRATDPSAAMLGGYGAGVKGLLRAREVPARAPMPADKLWGSSDWEIKPATGSNADRSVLNYNLISNFVDIDVGRDGSVPMKISGPGGDAALTIQIWSGHQGRVAGSGDTAPVLVQTLNPTFPAVSVASPTLVRHSFANAGQSIEAPFWWTFYTRGALGIVLNNNQQNNLPLAQEGKNSIAHARGRLFKTAGETRSGSSHTRSSFFFGFDAQDSVYRLFKPQKSSSVAEAEINEGSDVVQTVTVKHGDYRLTAAMPVVDADQWVPHRHYGRRRLAHSFTNFWSDHLPGYDYGTKEEASSRLVANAAYPRHRIPDLPILPDAVDAAQAFGDFDNGIGHSRDGPYINKPDEGNVNIVKNGGVPYLNEPRQHLTIDEVFFTPNRLITSPVMLGSLPTGVKNGKPWRTLQFRPQEGHPGGPAKLGGVNPPDHLLLEYFWMPVVEPYAISEPFSTAGKINLNYQILPFSNIRRASGLHAVLAGERVTAVPNTDAASYKVIPEAGNPTQFWTSDEGKRWHYKIDAEKTLAQFESRFAGGGAFLSPSEICDIHLVPNKDVDDASKMQTFWSSRRLTGDNTRERPYANIYPRITTRSNTFRVHYISQVIRKTRSSSPEVITAADKFESEHRGSAVIERYLDPAAADLPDFTTAAVTGSSAETLDNHYQFRVLEKRRFSN